MCECTYGASVIFFFFFKDFTVVAVTVASPIYSKNCLAGFLVSVKSLKLVGH